MCRVPLTVSLVVVAMLSSRVAAADPNPVVIPLWPATAPGETEALPEESEVQAKPWQKPVVRLTNISKPALHVFKPMKVQSNGAAVVIAPGGGYNILAWDLEGEEVARWLNRIGVTGIVLKYRVPSRPGTPRDLPPAVALHDAQRAIRLVRAKAKELGVDPHRIGMLGFSAGGHLTAWTATNFDKPSYSPVDSSDEQSCRPDFAVLIYPAYLTAKDKPDELASEIRVSEKTPPCFFAHAADDPIPAENSIRMFLELKKHKVPGELHIYSKGGHGFGLRPSEHPCSTWPDRCEAWLRSLGILAVAQK